MRFKLGGAHISIDYLFFFILVLMLLYNGSATLLMLGLSFLHEAGHTLALCCMGGRVRTLRLSAFGMVMVPASDCLSLYQNCAFVLAGPGVNLLIAAGLLLVPGAWAQQVSALSLLLGLFNLLPVTALDGGKAMWYFLLMHFNEQTVVRALRVVSIITLVLMGAYGCFLLWQNHHNFSVLLIVVYLTIFMINKPMN